MGLTADVELELQAAGLAAFLNKHEADYADLARSAFDFARDPISAAGLPVRRDDVAQALVLSLLTNDLFRDQLAKKKLGQKYWYRRFADLILDRMWEEFVGPRPVPKANGAHSTN